jgi:microfibrillar-associated protein 1
MRSHEKVREEVEARRAMPEELRMKEDMDRAKKLRDEKPKGQQGPSPSPSSSRSAHTSHLAVFLQKYHHKGAFYTVRPSTPLLLASTDSILPQDLEVLKKHDYTAPSQSTNRNIESLPAAMQVRNFGKMSQSKYTHLAKECELSSSQSPCMY